MATYYTPTVEDMIYGIEFEHYNFGEWHKDNSITNFIIACKVGATGLRIKHLDEDDIIDLGWDAVEKEKDTKDYGHAVQFLYGQFKMWFWEVNDIDIYLIVDTTYKGTEEEKIYSGKLPNKAELKRLMNNLSITK